MGFRAVLADADTHVAAGGDMSFEDARAAAVDYLRQRLERRNDHNPQRLANLRLALLRLRQARPPPAATAQ